MSDKFTDKWMTYFADRLAGPELGTTPSTLRFFFHVFPGATTSDIRRERSKKGCVREIRAPADHPQQVQDLSVVHGLANLQEVPDSSVIHGPAHHLKLFMVQPIIFKRCKICHLFMFQPIICKRCKSFWLFTVRPIINKWCKICQSFMVWPIIFKRCKILSGIHGLANHLQEVQDLS